MGAGGLAGGGGAGAVGGAGGVSAFRAVGSQLAVSSPAVRPGTSPLTMQVLCEVYSTGQYYSHVLCSVQYRTVLQSGGV